MKKRLFAMLLAGLLTASMASCVSTGQNNNTGENTQTLPPQTTTTTTGGTTVPTPTEWKDVDKTLYAFKATALYADAKLSSVKLADLPVESKLKCTKQNSYWCYVTTADGGMVGYVPAESLTSVDLLAETFTAVSGGEKTMYVAGEKGETVRVRLYPCTEDFSTTKATLTWNTPVTVVSENGEWSRIKYDENGTVKYYFISSKLLTATKQVDYDDPTQWENLFVNCATPLTKYVNSGSVFLRKAPNADATEIEVLTRDMEVTVKATAQIGESNWSYIEVWMPEKTAGDGPYLVKGYINSRLLSDTRSGAPATLDDLLALYPTFTKMDTAKEMYAAGQYYVRSTPLYPDDDDDTNIVATLSKAAKVTVVANGVYDGNSFYVIKYTVDGTAGYYFVGAAALTTDSTGEPILTLDTLIVRYPQFSRCTETTVTVASGKQANCYKELNSEGTFSGKPATSLEAGTAVTLVAKASSGSYWVIRTANGTLYFVNGTQFQS